MRSRLRAAWIGVFAVLFQAILFGWHHHDLQFGGLGHHAVVVASSAAPTDPGDDADGCEICIALHHQAAAPVAFLAPPAFDRPLTPPAVFGAAFIVRAEYRAFRSRAPPFV